MDQTPHNELIEATRSAHLALHRHGDIAQLLSPTLSSAFYANLLCAYFGFYQGLEEKRKDLTTWETFTLNYSLANLRSDLTSVGHVPQGLPIAPFEHVGNASDSLGALYVLHGTKAGGAILAKRVQYALPNVPIGFLAAPQDRKLWDTLINTIDDLQRGDLEYVIASANRTFTNFGNWVSTQMARSTHPSELA